MVFFIHLFISRFFFIIIVILVWFWFWFFGFLFLFNREERFIYIFMEKEKNRNGNRVLVQKEINLKNRILKWVLISGTITVRILLETYNLFWKGNLFYN